MISIVQNQNLLLYLKIGENSTLEDRMYLKKPIGDNLIRMMIQTLYDQKIICDYSVVYHRASIQLIDPLPVHLFNFAELSFSKILLD